MNKGCMFALSLIACAGTACAQTLTVEYRVGSTWFDATTGGTPPATITGINVSIDSVPSGADRFRVYYTDGLANLGVVSYNIDVNSTVLISSGGALDSINPIADGAVDWAGLAGTHAYRARIQVALTGSLTGPITARKITRIDVNGDIAGDITMDDAETATPPRIIALNAVGSISGDIVTEEGDIGKVFAGTSISSETIWAEGDISEVFAGTSISGELISAGGEITSVSAGTSIATETIEAGGDIKEVVAGTSITSATIEADGTIDLVFAGDGDIGTSSVPTLIQSNKINGTPAVNIGIVTGENIYADIIASVTTTAKGDIERIIASTNILVTGGVDTNLTQTPGEYVGSVVANTGSFYIGSAIPTFNSGDFDGDITYLCRPETAVVFSSLSSTGSIIVNESLESVVPPLTGNADEIIVIGGDPAVSGEALAGQVIVNALDGGFGWTGEVFFSGASTPFTLCDNEPQPDEAPFYHRLSQELGGGAIGLAPFNFHQRTNAPPSGVARDCDPFQEEWLALGLLDILDEVTISHYGPVYAIAAESFRVEYRFLPGRPWIDRSKYFEVDFTQSGDDEATATRDIVIKGSSLNSNGFKASGEWRIRPLAGKLRCADVDANPDVEYNSDITGVDAGDVAGVDPSHDWYYFRISLFSGSQALVGGGTVTMSDLSAWGDEPYETNADGSTNTGDLVELIDAFGE